MDYAAGVAPSAVNREGTAAAAERESTLTANGLTIDLGRAKFDGTAADDSVLHTLRSRRDRQIAAALDDGMFDFGARLGNQGRATAYHIAFDTGAG